MAIEKDSTDYFNNSKLLKYGFFVGGNGSSIYGSNTKKIIYKMSFNGGITAIKKYSDNLHIRLGLYYVNKGYKTSVIHDLEFIDKKQRYYFITEYLEFPILMQFYMPIKNYYTNWMLGLAPAINLTTKQKTKIDKEITESTIDDKNRFFDISLIVGTNIMLDSHWNLDIRAVAGLIPIYKNSDLWGNRNISLILSLGYFLYED